jgi:hypothetical protein
MLGRTVTSCSADNVGTYTCTLVKGGNATYVLWNSDRTVTIKVPSGVTMAQKVTGEQQPVSTGSALPIDAMPVLLQSQG